MAKKASDSDQLFPYYQAGLEQALAKRSASLYGSQGMMRGMAGGAAAGSIAALYKGKPVKRYKRDSSGRRVERGGRKTRSAIKVGSKLGLGAAIGSAIGAGVGLMNPEAGMAMGIGGAGFAAGSGIGKGVGAIVRGARKRSTSQRFASPQTVASGRGSAPSYYRNLSGIPGNRGIGIRMAAARSRADRLSRADMLMKKGTKNYGAATATGIGTIAATLAGKFYGYNSDRFEKAKQGATDPSFGTTMTTPSIPGYSPF